MEGCFIFCKLSTVVDPRNIQTNCLFFSGMAQEARKEVAQEQQRGTLYGTHTQDFLFIFVACWSQTFLELIILDRRQLWGEGEDSNARIQIGCQLEHLNEYWFSLLSADTLVWAQCCDLRQHKSEQKSLASVYVLYLNKEKFRGLFQTLERNTVLDFCLVLLLAKGKLVSILNGMS